LELDLWGHERQRHVSHSLASVLLLVSTTTTLYLTLYILHTYIQNGS
jgi:hypothetical protein